MSLISFFKMFIFFYTEHLNLRVESNRCMSRRRDTWKKIQDIKRRLLSKKHVLSRDWDFIFNGRNIVLCTGSPPPTLRRGRGRKQCHTHPPFLKISDLSEGWLDASPVVNQCVRSYTRSTVFLFSYFFTVCSSQLSMYGYWSYSKYFFAYWTVCK